ncbi:hypothetical protein HZ326_3381 [Fusarium oxysporum f. sp. albedinis]|nr:hypothetical protein HZ326_3381 [Fusarium oxysporum f. sp. albedinis]
MRSSNVIICRGCKHERKTVSISTGTYLHCPMSENFGRLCTFTRSFRDIPELSRLSFRFSSEDNPIRDVEYPPRA